MLIFKNGRWIYCEADKGTEGSDTVDATGTNSGTEPAQTYTAADLERIVKERLDREKRAEDGRRQMAERKAAEQALADQQNFKTLAEQREARITELETSTTALQAQVERYAATFSKLLEAQLAKVPDYVRELLHEKDPVDQMDWLTRNAATMGATPIPPVPGTPRPNGSGGQASIVDDYINRLKGK